MPSSNTGDQNWRSIIMKLSIRQVRCNNMSVPFPISLSGVCVIALLSPRDEPEAWTTKLNWS